MLRTLNGLGGVNADRSDNSTADNGRSIRRRQTIETAQGRQVGGARQAGDGARSRRGSAGGGGCRRLTRARDRPPWMCGRKVERLN